AGLANELQEFDARSDALVRVGDAFGAKKHCIAANAAHVATGQRVITEECHAPGGEKRGAERDKTVAHRLRNPGIDAVSKNVVELSELRSNCEDIAFKEANVGQSQFADALPTTFDRQARKIESDELSAGNGIGHRNDVRALAAADFEHTAILDWRRAMTVENCLRGKVTGMRIRKRIAGIGNCVVGGRHKGKKFPRRILSYAG